MVKSIKLSQTIWCITVLASASVVVNIFSGPALFEWICALLLVAIAGVVIRRNIRERKIMEADLRKAKEAAETASRTKSEFLAHMSHEIRTPLNGVIGMTELLLGLELSDRQRHYAELVHSSGESLAALLNDILDFSKIEAGKLEIECVEFDLLEIVEDIVEVMSHRAAQKGLEIACHADSDVPRLVKGDPERVRQILVNLINNAIKFTDTGSVSIRMTSDHTEDTRAVVRFDVTDTGIGIPPDRAGRLFKSFSQVDASTTRKYGGTGLGLAISMQLTELMRGEIGVFSEVGKGSTFWFTIPFATIHPLDLSASSQLLDMQNIRVLAVDDNPGSREALREQITSWGLEAATASGGPEALRLLGDGLSSGKAFLVAIVDEDMPGMNGFDLARTIKADTALRESVLLILVCARSVDKTQLRESGFVGHMNKPVKQSQLFDAIMDAVAVSREQETETTTRPAKARPVCSHGIPVTKGARILIAEDNRVNQIVAAEILRDNGYDIDVVGDGRKAVEALRTGNYDLVLMDCQMPEMDGFEATQAIRWWENKTLQPLDRRLPIIALTASAIKGDRERCLEAGMDSYVGKPIKPKLLIETIEASLTKVSNARIGKEAELPHQADNAKSASSTLPESVSPPFSIDAIFEVCLGNTAVAAEVLDEFEQQLVADLDKVQTSIDDNDSKRTAAVAHSLKGAAGMVDAKTVQKIASDLETMGRADNLASAARSVEELAKEVGRCLEYLPAVRMIVSERVKS